MNKSFITILLFCISNFCHSQVSIVFTAPGDRFGNQFDLWDFMLTKSQQQSNIPYIVEVSLKDNQNNPIVIGITQPFSITATKFLKGSIESLQAKMQNFPNSKSEYFFQTNRLLSGQYEICITVRSTDEPSIVASECQQIAIENQLLIHQITPYDNEIVFTSSPILSWNVLPISEKYYYKVLIVPESFKNIQMELNSTMSYLSDRTFTSKHITYPLDAHKLQVGSTYVWQVVVFEGRNELIRSDIWKFSIGQTHSRSPIDEDSYRNIETTVNSKPYLFSENVYFSYDNAANDDSLNYTLIDVSNGTKVNMPIGIDLVFGLNKISIDSQALGLTENHNYILQLKDSYSRKFKLAFTYISE